MDVEDPCKGHLREIELLKHEVELLAGQLAKTNRELAAYKEMNQLANQAIDQVLGVVAAYNAPRSGFENPR